MLGRDFNKAPDEEVRSQKTRVRSPKRVHVILIPPCGRRISAVVLGSNQTARESPQGTHKVTGGNAPETRIPPGPTLQGSNKNPIGAVLHAAHGGMRPLQGRLASGLPFRGRCPISAKIRIASRHQSCEASPSPPWERGWWRVGLEPGTQAVSAALRALASAHCLLPTAYCLLTPDSWILNPALRILAPANHRRILAHRSSIMYPNHIREKPTNRQSEMWLVFTALLQGISLRWGHPDHCRAGR